MSDAPLETQVGLDLYEGVEPLTFADEEVGWPLAHYLDAIGLILEETAYIVRADDEGNDGWSAFADPQRCPPAYLFTLAQWAGVRYPRRMSIAELRALIDGNAPGLWRGTKRAILAAVRRYLTPGAHVYFEERADGRAYYLRCFTYEHETLDEAGVRRELLAQVPAGIIVDYEVRVGQTYEQLRAGVATYAQMTETYATYAAVTHAEPTGEP